MTDYVDAGEAVAHRQLSAVRQEAPPTGPSPASAGRLGASGVGRDGGDFGLHAYSELQSIMWPS